MGKRENSLYMATFFIAMLNYQRIAYKIPWNSFGRWFLCKTRECDHSTTCSRLMLGDRSPTIVRTGWWRQTAMRPCPHQTSKHNHASTISHLYLPFDNHSMNPDDSTNREGKTTRFLLPHTHTYTTLNSKPSQRANTEANKYNIYIYIFFFLATLHMYI